MKSSVIISSFLIFFYLACGPEKTIDNRGASADSLQNSEGQDIGVDTSDFSDAQDQSYFYQKYQIQIDWEKPPIAGAREENQFSLQIKSLKGEAIKMVFFDFRIYMKIHGHGGLDKSRVIEDREGYKFTCSNFFFTMPGPWELKLRFVIGKEKYTVELPIEVVDG